MPRNGSGTYSLPSSYEAVPGETILAAQHNDPLEDLEADANAARPIGAGGTGAATAVAANDKLNTTSSNIASASTVNLANATGVVVNITGTTTITALGTVSSGAQRVLVFAGALTLTHDGTSLILPGAANIITAAGDVAVMRSLGSGNWRCVSYMRAAGLPATAPASTDNAVARYDGTNGALQNSDVTIDDSGNITAAGLTLESDDDGATAAPSMVLDRNSASPATSDVLGKISLQGRDSGGNETEYAYIEGQIVTATDGAEDGQFRFSTVRSGTGSTRMVLGSGLQVGSPTGGDKGAGTINAAGSIYVNNSAVITAASFASQYATDAIYTGSSSSNTNFPVGETVMMNNATGLTRNGTVSVRLHESNSGAYNQSGSGSILSGTWRCRGVTEDGSSQMKRTA